MGEGRRRRRLGRAAQARVQGRLCVAAQGEAVEGEKTTGREGTGAGLRGNVKEEGRGQCRLLASGTRAAPGSSCRRRRKRRHGSSSGFPCHHCCWQCCLPLDPAAAACQLQQRVDGVGVSRRAAPLASCHRTAAWGARCSSSHCRQRPNHRRRGNKGVRARAGALWRRPRHDVSRRRRGRAATAASRAAGRRSGETALTRHCCHISACCRCSQLRRRRGGRSLGVGEGGSARASRRWRGASEH